MEQPHPPQQNNSNAVPVQHMQYVQAPPPHVSPKGTWVTKLIFRIISVIIAIACIGIAADSAARLDYSAASIMWFGGPTVVTVVWGVAEIICILARRGHRGIHPGAIVGVDLILWLSYVCLAVVYGLFGNLSLSDIYSYYSYDYWGGSYSSYGDFSALQAMNQASMGLACTLALNHFALFVIGCVETNIRNSKSRAPQVVVYAGAPGPGMQPMYYNPHQSMVVPPGAYQVPAGYPPAEMQNQQYVPYQQQHLQPKDQYSMNTSPPQVPSPVHTSEIDGRSYHNHNA